MSERNIEWVSQEDLRRITGKDRRTIHNRLQGFNYKQEGRKKLFDKTLALQAILTKTGASGDGDAVKERKTLAEAEKAELIVARLKGELVPVADMKTAAADLIKTLYARMVRVTPSILAPQLVNKTDIIEIEGIIRDAYADVFNELKTMPETFLTVETVDEITEETTDDEAPAE